MPRGAEANYCVQHPNGETTQSGKGENCTAFRDNEEKQSPHIDCENREDILIQKARSSSRTALGFQTSLANDSNMC